MPTASISAIKNTLIKHGLKEREDKNGYFECPKSISGKKITIYLSSKNTNKDRSIFLNGELSTTLKEFNPVFVSGSAAKSSAGHLGFQGSQIHIITKIIKEKGVSSNKGILFEQYLEKDLNRLKNEESGYIYGDFIKKFEDEILKDDKITKIENTGSKNTPRPLKFDSKGLYVSLEGGSRTSNIGGGLADIKVTTKSGKVYNLSLKFGTTVTFFNSGLGNKNFPPDGAFPLDEFKSANFTQPVGKAIIDLFGLDPFAFRDVFLNYKEKSVFDKKTKSVKSRQTVKVDSNKLKDFIKTVIGCNYYLLHLDDDEKTIHMYDVTESFLNKAATPIGNTVDVLYPTGGSAKRIDIELETSLYKLKFNIRNKQGGILPSHIMCDYQMKHNSSMEE